MGKIQKIQNELQNINGTVFQDLCDQFLVATRDDVKTIGRKGSQLGKQKTVRGTPDTLVETHSGYYLFVEITTDKSTKNKLQNDIQACFDLKKVDKECQLLIKEIILFYNWSISKEEERALSKLARKYKSDVNVTFFDIDTLSLKILQDHSNLASEYLDLPFDSGQVIPINDFINEYNKASQGIAAPLDNTFCHRENEKAEICDFINDNDFLIICGNAGYGKTRLVIESANNFVKDNDTYKVYCISNKGYNFLEDLNQNLPSNENFILIVDDANRIDKLIQILGFYNKKRVGSLKIVLTVRGYAYDRMSKMIQDYNPYTYNINKLDNDEIKSIICAEPYKILNQEFQNKILEISDGNPRLAIMMSILAKESNSLESLYNVSDVFNRYFNTYLSHNPDLNKPIYMKCLGLVSFFNGINYEDKGGVEKILYPFGLTYNEFIDAVVFLESKELLETYKGYVRSPEQNLAVFLFYSVFIKDGLLEFGSLLFSFFNGNEERFRDNIVQAHNKFGSDEIQQIVTPALLKYYHEIQSDERLAYNFLKIFWFYLDEQGLLYCYEHITSLPDSKKSEFITDYENNAFSYKRNQYIDLIGNYFTFPYKINDALELLIEYVRKEPDVLPEIIYEIRERITITNSDRLHLYFKQNIVIDKLLLGIEQGCEISELIFFEISKDMLQLESQYSTANRKSFTLHTIKLENSDALKELREKIWNGVVNNFTKQQTLGFKLLESISLYHYKTSIEVFKIDLPFIVQICEKHLNINNIKQCKYVLNIASDEDLYKVANEEMNKLFESFNSSLYKLYIDLDFNFIRDRKNLEIENYGEYDDLKITQISEKYSFKTEGEFISFYNDYVEVYKQIKNEHNTLKRGFEQVLINHLDNFDKLKAYIKIILLNGNEVDYIPYKLFRFILKDKNSADQVLEIINEGEYKLKIYWLLSYFEYIEEGIIDENTYKQFLSLFDELNGRYTISLDLVKKYINKNSNFIPLLFNKILDINKKKNVNIEIGHNFFEDEYLDIVDDQRLINDTYTQQFHINGMVCYQDNYLINILKKSPEFLLEFVKSLYHEDSKKNLRNSHLNLGSIWEVENIDETLYLVFELLIEKETYFGILEHPINIFFKGNLSDSAKIKSKRFLKKLIDEKSDDVKSMNAVVSVLRNARRDIFDELLIYYLRLNNDPKAFSGLNLISSGGSFGVDQIMHDTFIAEWEVILKLVEESDLGIKAIPIKNQIKQEIQYQKSFSNRERVDKFLRNW